MVFFGTTNGKEHGTKACRGAQALTKFPSVREEILLGGYKGNKLNRNINLHGQKSTLQRLEPHADMEQKSKGVLLDEWAGTACY